MMPLLRPRLGVLAVPVASRQRLLLSCGFASASSRGASAGSRSATGAEESPWVEVKDPAGSGRTYWWNRTTNQTTPLGAARPDLPQTILDRAKAFKDDVARQLHARNRGGRIIIGDGGYCVGGGGGDAGGGGSG
uniref:Uncharacterized protein n=1 Tax=Alexandrium monilatum TaxID=311494 RepID=A0A7S4T1D2_9DINO|mmetsp:Transcript_61739/g.183932  ORF Transcript_61739/g.183932 Transcript_61739/m.183932 type:complete len:134 (-) Transcript_61739:24-425(-)